MGENTGRSSGDSGKVLSGVEAIVVTTARVSKGCDTGGSESAAGALSSV